jgi:hypothetical protein
VSRSRARFGLLGRKGGWRNGRRSCCWRPVAWRRGRSIASLAARLGRRAGGKFGSPQTGSPVSTTSPVRGLTGSMARRPTGASWRGSMRRRRRLRPVDGAAAFGRAGRRVEPVHLRMRTHKIDLAARKSWCVSSDPQFVAKSSEIVGLLSRPAAERHRPLGRREAEHPGARARPGLSAAAERPFAERADARVQTPRHDHPLRRDIATGKVTAAHYSGAGGSSSSTS